HLRRGGETERLSLQEAGLTYCQQVTREQFEAQKRTHSEQALMDLFDDILRDPRISDKQRSLRMKQVWSGPDLFLCACARSSELDC
ncbi:hypothetical protein V5799_010250, partial [Amblyomma americanum]